MKNQKAFPNPHRTDITGMTMQQYAAIKLKVPNSGIDWLDEMIRQSLKDDFAAKAMQAFISAYPCQAIDREDGGIPTGAESISGDAYEMADAMLKARDQ
jgi:hypothetical protein